MLYINLESCLPVSKLRFPSIQQDLTRNGTVFSYCKAVSHRPYFYYFVLLYHNKVNFLCMTLRGTEFDKGKSLRSCCRNL